MNLSQTVRLQDTGTHSIWRDKTLTLFCINNETSRKLPLLSPDCTAPTNIVGTPRLLQRYNKPNPVRLTTGNRDTPPIWTDKSLSLNGFNNEISRKLPLFSPDSTAPTNILGTPRLYKGTTNPIQCVRPQNTGTHPQYGWTRL